MTRVILYTILHNRKDTKTLTFLVVNPESLFEFLLERLLILLNQEPGGKLAELAEFQKTGA